MRVALVGATGFIGGYLIDKLLAAGHEPSVLVRPGSDGVVRDRDRCRVVDGDPFDAESLEQLLSGCDAAVFLIGILREDRKAGITFDRLQREAAERFANQAVASGVRRFLLMSANGVRPDGTAYQKSKFAAEQALSALDLELTVFRPSVVFGDPRGQTEIGTQLLNDVIRLPLPAPGFTTSLSEETNRVAMSPVHVEDVADAFVAALEDDTTVGQTYELGGPEALTWSAMIRRVAEAVDRRKLVLPAPIALVRIPVALLDWIPGFPVTADQLDMLADGNTAAADTLQALIGRQAVAFDKQSLAYLRHKEKS